MFIREIWGKFTSFIFWNCEISKSELGKFIPNFPLKHVITSTNDPSLLQNFKIVIKNAHYFYLLFEMHANDTEQSIK